MADSLTLNTFAISKRLKGERFSAGFDSDTAIDGQIENGSVSSMCTIINSFFRCRREV